MSHLHVVSPPPPFFFSPKHQVLRAKLKSLTLAGTDKQQSCDLIVFINSLWKSFTIKHD